MAGTPIIVNVTGGLQDQCGFKKKSDGKYFTQMIINKLVHFIIGENGKIK